MKNIFFLVGVLLLFTGCAAPQSLSNRELPQSSSGAMVNSHENHMMVHSDRDFIALMIPHHEEAIVSSKELLQMSSTPKIRALAEGIVSAQEKEIALMQEWSTEWFQKDVSREIPYMPMMPDISKLKEMDAEKAYMEGMIGHHQGAIQMAKDILKVTSRPEIQKLAKEIIQAQEQEIQTLMELLKVYVSS